MKIKFFPVVLAFALIGCGSDQKNQIVETSQPVSNLPENIETTQPVSNSLITQENFEKLEAGMSLEQVESILGKGKLTHQSVDQFGKFESYTWENQQDFESYLNIVTSFQDDRLISKNSFGW